MKIAIIGAGVSGLACGRALSERGYAPVLFEKARGPWGRLATRRLADGGSGWDFGAQYFTTRDPAFAAVVAALEAEGRVARWEGRIAALGADGRARAAGGDTRWVAVPGMSALGLALGRGLDLRAGVRVAAIDAHAHGVTLRDADGADLGRFDRVVMALPAPQAETLARGYDEALGAALAAVPMAPCWAGLAALSAPVEVPWDGAFTEEGSEVLGWIARDSTKPGRPGGERWVLHARSDWSAAHLEEAPEVVAHRLSEAFVALTGHPERPVTTAHRWRYARGEAAAPGCLQSADQVLTACGDWTRGGRVEGAWLSGLEAAESVLR